MRNKAILFSSLLLASSSLLAEQSVLDNTAKPTANETTQAVTPATVQPVEQAPQALDKAKNVTKAVEKRPAVLEDKMKESAAQTVNKAVKQASPQEVQAAQGAFKSGKATAKNLMQIYKEAPKEQQNQLKQKAVSKLMKFLQKTN